MGNYNITDVARRTTTNTQTNLENSKDENQLYFEIDDQVTAYFTSMKICPDGIPKSLSQVLKLSPVVKEKWGVSIKEKNLGTI